MTNEQISIQMRSYSDRIEELCNQIKLTENFEEKKIIIDEMIYVANEMSKLDSKNKRCLLKQIKNEFRNLKKRLSHS